MPVEVEPTDTACPNPIGRSLKTKEISADDQTVAVCTAFTLHGTCISATEAEPGGH